MNFDCSKEPLTRQMTEIDIKLLQVFNEIYVMRSVSKAALNLELSQPTISFNLAKLRDHYEDPLFVRAPSGMEPTAFAAELHHCAVGLLATFDAVVKHRKSFDPETAKQVFRIAMTDISQSVLLPRLLNRLRSVAPGLQIRVLNIDEHTAQLLEAGEADLAVGFMPQLHVGFYQQKLFSQYYVGMAASNHPRLERQPSLETFLAEGHAIVTASGTGHAVIDRTLRLMDRERRVVLEVPNYLGLSDIIANTDLVATVPLRLAQLFTHDPSIHLFDLPFAVDTYQIKQHWHERFHHDIAHRWLRAVLTDLFLESGDDIAQPAS